MNRLLIIFLFVSGLAFAGSAGEAGRYIETDDYLSSVFPGGPPAAKTLWVTGDVRNSVEDILGHKFNALRVRYWYDGEKSAWILEEVGKELPITIGVAVNAATIENVRILEFRESRGWEVRYPFFTNQFTEATLSRGDKLDRHIDNISGATLSVNAVTRIARVALVLNEHISEPQESS